MISLLQHYELGIFKAVKVDYKNLGDYYDPKVGNNAWGYYFEPIELGNQNGPSVEYSYLFAAEIVELFNSREYNAYIVNKYIKIKPHIKKKVDNFIASQFSDNNVIGVHYRGTDKIGEAPRVPYDVVVNAIWEQINLCGMKNCKIFIASDEPAFFDYCEQQFPGMIIAYSRTSKPRGSYLAGETAVLDCVLLSRCNVLIRTSSHLSLISTFFNPNISVIELNQRSYKYDPYLTGWLHDPYSYRTFSSTNIKEIEDLFQTLQQCLPNIQIQEQ